MLRISASDHHRYCDGLSRRSFLQAGALGLAGLALPDVLRLRAQASQPGRDTAVILIWLDGGPTHMETYDLKPDAPADYRGPLKPIQTNVPGIAISELFPRQAKVMDKLTIIRSVHHTTGDHFAGAHWMLTGYHGSNAINREPMYPSAGSITAKLRGANRPGLPAYVAVPFAASVGLNPGYNSGAYLGPAYHPFAVNSDPNLPQYSARNMSLPTGMTVAQLEDRKNLRQAFDTIRRDVDRTGAFDSLDRFQQQAYELVTSPAARDAFDINKEDAKMRDRYGRHTWGQSTLLARRLVEAGVTFVTVHCGGWDHHAQIEQGMRRNLPIVDNAIGSLVEDLAERGLLEKTAIFLCGEFGRTPKLNQTAGRDHWGQSGFALLGGGGIRTGVAYGSTTDKGEYPKDRPATPEDLLATLYSVLGIDPSVTFEDKSGRPHPVLAKGQPIKELL